VNTVILNVRAPAEAMVDFVRVGKTGKSEQTARISFATPELLWEVLSVKRWELLKAFAARARCRSERLRVALTGI
jgi:hypothetical protein